MANLKEGMNLVPRRQGWGLSSCIVALSLVLLLVVQAAVFAVVQANIERNALQQVAQELKVDEKVWKRLLDQNAQKLSQAAALLAADFGFRSAVTSGDLATIRSVLDNHGARIGASVTALIDSQLQLTTVGEGQDPQALKALGRRDEARAVAIDAVAQLQRDQAPGSPRLAAARALAQGG